MLSNTAEYALRAMAWLTLTPDELVSAGSLAQHTRVPADYLAKILQQLSQAGLITGRRGVGGGYKLAKPAEEIYMLDVLNVVDPVERLRSCPVGLETHGPNLCPLHQKIDEAIAAVCDVFGNVTLTDLCTEGDGIKPLCEVNGKGEGERLVQPGGMTAPPATPPAGQEPSS
jgi:Rrf2 family protein